MIQILWGVLNISLLLAFIFLVIRAVKAIKQQMGWLAALVLVFGLLAFGNRKVENSPKQNDFDKVGFVDEDSVAMYSTRQVNADLEENLSFTNTLSIYYGNGLTSRKNQPTKAFSSLYGFNGGFLWKPRAIVVNVNESGNKLRYTVLGTLSWTLLGMPLYVQPKYYEGSVSLN